MSHVKAMIILRLDSGLPEDSPVNTLHFNTLSSPEPYAAIATAIEGAYNTFRTNFPATVEQNGHRIKMYEMADSTPRVPVFDDTFDLSSNPTGDSLPPEIALCCSFQGARASGQSQARRRGRVYLGPCKEDDNSALGVPGSTVIANAAAFGNFLLNASIAAGSWEWCVYSPTDDELVPVTNGWVDNAWDVQRRRGLGATSRTVFVGD